MPGAFLLNVHVRNAMLRQCKPHTRQGKLTIEGSYHPEVIQRAFDTYGEWKLIARNGRTNGNFEITDPDKIGDLLAFQVRNRDALPACMTNIQVMNSWQELTGCQAHKFAHGCCRVTATNECFFWVASPTMPLSIEFSSTAISSFLRVKGCIGRLDREVRKQHTRTVHSHMHVHPSHPSSCMPHFTLVCT